MEKYTIGIDFGTESGRVLIVNIDDGSIKGQCVIPYAHGVITEMLPTNDGTRLPRDYALQHPGDYLEVIMKGIPHAIKDANISSSQIIGIGIDFTSSTMVAVDEKGKTIMFSQGISKQSPCVGKIMEASWTEKRNRRNVQISFFT
ncbi:hypothetical protein APP_29300 [Aeribacillus pallidus]|uniref:FGGY family carbohydrate kinase n=1 Tax=Aeribacillus sp. FSL K6-8394 TaxID=2954570 RepID=UPI001397984E|nr:hypothetical protein APP_29300 [Aeribacillus pallidus]